MIQQVLGWWVSLLNSFYDFQYDRIWQNTQEDNHLMDVYRSLGLTFLPGQYKIVDQPLVEVPQGTEGSKTVEIKRCCR